MISPIAQRMMEAADRKGVSLTAAALKAGKSASFIRQLVKGRARSTTIEAIEDVAAALETNPIWLAFGVGDLDTTTPQDNTLPLLGSVAAGIWREQIVPSDVQRLPIPPDPNFPRAAQFLLRAEGESMNRLFPPGALLHCLDLDAAGVEAQHRDILIIEQTRATGEVEATAKRLTRQNGRIVFAAESDDPAWAGRVIDPAEGLRERGIVSVRTRALVLRAIVPLVREA